MTKTGDDGTTSLSKGERVSKDSPRIAAIGSLDETNSAIGVAMAQNTVEEIAGILKEIQNVLFNVSGELAVVDKKLDLISSKDIQFLESNIHKLNSSLPLLKEFIFPGGSSASAHLHLARSICRRAERDLVAFGQHESINPLFLTYLNRLSDFLFVAARYQNKKDGGEEGMWERK